MPSRVLPWTTEAEYLASWVWPSPRGGWYCRLTGVVFATEAEAVAYMRRRDREAGIVWPWQPGSG
jgi:hypothetical protein